MTDADITRSRSDDDILRSRAADDAESNKTLRNYLLGGAAVVITGLVSAGIIGFTSMTFTGDKTATKLTILFDQLAETIKDERRDRKDRDSEQTRMLQDITAKIPQLYTREEARQFNEAADRRFQLLALQFSEFKSRTEEQSASVNRRLEQLERAVLDRPRGR